MIAEKIAELLFFLLYLFSNLIMLFVHFISINNIIKLINSSITL